MKVDGNKMQNCRATWTTNFAIGIGMFLSLLHCFTPASALYEPDRIIGLPGLNFSLNFAHFSGYLDVSADRHLFYWFVTSQNNPSTDPLLFWFNGGPGSSSLYGMLTEIGPYLVNETGKKLEKNNFAWNRNASIVAIEAPAGVGFSYNTTQYIWSDDNTSADNYAAIKQFFVKFPEFRNNSVFLTGESYAGVYVPTLVERILDGQRSYPINLQGMAIGNAQLNDTLDVITQMQWGYYHGFIDEVEFKQLQMSCKYNIDDCNRTVVQNFWLQHAAVPWWQLDQYDVMQACVDVQTIGSDNQTVTTLRCENAFYDGALGVYLNQTKVRQALHVADAVMNKNWTVDNDTIFNAFVRTHGVGDRFADLNRAVNRTMETIFKRIIDAGIRTMLYYGDTDSFTNFLLGQKFAANLGYDQTTETKMAWSHLGQNAGMVTGYGNLTYTTVRGASHMVPQKRPAQILQAINAFMNNQELGPLSN